MESRSFFRVFHLGSRVQALGPSSSTFLGTLVGSWSETRAARIQTGTQTGFQCYRLYLLWHNANPELQFLNNQFPIVLPSQKHNKNPTPVSLLSPLIILFQSSVSQLYAKQLFCCWGKRWKENEMHIKNIFKENFAFSLAIKTLELHVRVPG